MKRLVLSVVLCAVLAPAAHLRAELIYAVTTTNVLLSFDSATPGTVTTIAPITGLQAGENILGIDLRPATGQLSPGYAVSAPPCSRGCRATRTRTTSIPS